MDAKLAQSVRRKVGHHLSGIAIVSTVCALARKGVFGRLACSRAPVDVSALADEVGCSEGCFHLAVRLLEDQGLVRRVGDLAGGRIRAVLTTRGVEWLGMLSAYDSAPEVIKLADAFPAWLAGRKKLDPYASRRLAGGPEDIPASPMGGRVRFHMQGFLVAAVLAGFAEKGILERLGRQRAVDPAELPGEATAIEAGFNILQGQGWVVREGWRWSLTQEGSLARMTTPQYLPALAYLATFRDVPRILSGEGSGDEGAGGVVERLVNRGIDVGFSGQVFSKAYRQRFLELALPLFQDRPIEMQPNGIVDVGSGDGTLLMELFQAVKERTERGGRLAEFPLVMVGVDIDPVAIDATAGTLRAAGVPHVVLAGDVDDPDGIAESLARHGIDWRTMLYVSKSVIHNRTYRPPRDSARVARWKPESTATFVGPGGDLIPARDMECNLVEHFERWAPLVACHGMIVMETHTIDPTRVSGAMGMGVITCLDASHGYSHQYPIEIEVYYRAAQAAGFVSLSSRGFGQDITGHPFLTIDHFASRRLS